MKPIPTPIRTENGKRYAKIFIGGKNVRNDKNANLVLIKSVAKM